LKKKRKDNKMLSKKAKNGGKKLDKKIIKENSKNMNY
jgi:hypothetical protein